MILLAEQTINKFKKLILITLILTFILTPKTGYASVLSDLAATMQPGEIVELVVDESSVSTCEAMMPFIPDRHPAACVDENGNQVPDPHSHGCPVSVLRPLGNILEFTDEAHWDSITKEVYVAGTRRPYKPWDQGISRYSEETNSWTILDTPPFGFGAHGYDNGAIDVARRTFYWSRVAQANNVWAMNLDSQVWVQLPNAPINAGEQSALEYFPDIDRVVFFDARRGRASMYALYNPNTNEWAPPVSLAEPFGQISHFSEYSPNHGTMFFGGGFNPGDITPDINESRRFYMLDENQVVHRLADSPTYLGQSGSGPVQTTDPSTGNLVVFQGRPNPDSEATCPGPGPLPIWEYDLSSNTWGQTGTQSFTRLYCSMDTVAVPLPEYGVNFIVSIRGETNCKVFLYRHSPMEPAPPSITIQPASQSVEEGSSVTFRLAASGTNPLVYQWFLNGDEIPGATDSQFTIEQVTAADAADYHSTVRNDLGNVTSDIAELVVVVDTTAPLIDSASIPSSTQIDIRFSETVEPSSAETAANYQVNQGIQVLAATLNANNTTVHLQTDELTTDTTYTITINNIQDTSAAANEIAANSSVDATFAPVMNFDNGLWPLDWIPLDSDKWRIEADNGNNAWFLHEKNYNPLSGDRLGEYVISPDSYGNFVFQAQIRTVEDAGNSNADYAMVFGFVDGSNYYYMMFNRTQSNTVLFKVVNGERQEMAVATDDWLSDNEYHAVEVRRTGDDIEVLFDGNPVLEVTDTTFLNGKLGLGSFNDSAYFDDIRISVGSAAISDLIFSDAFE